MSNPIINLERAHCTKLLSSLPQTMQVGVDIPNWENPAKDNTTTRKDPPLLRCQYAPHISIIEVRMRKEVLMNPLNNLVQEWKRYQLNQSSALLRSAYTEEREESYRQARSKCSILRPLISINFKKRWSSKAKLSSAAGEVHVPTQKYHLEWKLFNMH